MQAPKNSNKCAALCCNSKLSTSSSPSTEPNPPSELSGLTHSIVQSRLQRMIEESEITARVQRRRRSRKLVVLVAEDRSSDDAKRDFRDSMLDVIVSRGMKEPKELRSLLNWYISLNSAEHREVILEAFYDVCRSIFICEK
ncbi:uncharacterized protein A4U43_C08F7590 [Asparagus officinalis]|nr:uncharacterized protein A4U43_C08F7590 [Asparagus officinalis]